MALDQPTFTISKTHQHSTGQYLVVRGATLVPISTCFEKIEKSISLSDCACADTFLKKIKKVNFTWLICKLNKTIFAACW